MSPESPKPKSKKEIIKEVNERYKGAVKEGYQELYDEGYKDFPLPGLGRLLALGHSAWMVNRYKRQAIEAELNRPIDPPTIGFSIMRTENGMIRVENTDNPPPRTTQE